MKKLGWLAILPLLPLLAACNPSAIKQGDPLYDYMGKDYYLARPLTGPRYRHTNVYGVQPMLASGTQVTVKEIERSTPHYRVTFTGPDKCGTYGCVTHWRHKDDADFQEKFERVFSETNPVEELGEKVRKLIENHQVAGNMTPAELVLSIGDPNRWVENEDGSQKWIYETRGCDVKARLVAIPELAVYISADGKVTKAEPMDNGEWYATDEPVNQLSGLCQGVDTLPEDTAVRPAQAGDMEGHVVEDRPPSVGD